MFLDHTQRRSTVGRTPLDEWSARHRDLYLTTHNTHNRHTSMPPLGFEPTILAGERPQTYALDGAATGTGTKIPVGPQNTCKTQPQLHISAKLRLQFWEYILRIFFFLCIFVYIFTNFANELVRSLCQTCSSLSCIKRCPGCTTRKWIYFAHFVGRVGQR